MSDEYPHSEDLAEWIHVGRCPGCENHVPANMFRTDGGSMVCPCCGTVIPAGRIRRFRNERDLPNE